MVAQTEEVVAPAAIELRTSGKRKANSQLSPRQKHCALVDGCIQNIVGVRDNKLGSGIKIVNNIRNHLASDVLVCL